MAFVLLAARRGPSEVPPETQRALGDEILAAFRQPSEEITAAAEYLRGKGHRVDITADGAEAIDIVRHELPDVVVASFWLLRRDGFDLLDTLKERVPPGRARVAWITSMTADAETEPARDWHNALIGAYLTVPYTRWQVVIAVEQLMFRLVLPAESIL